MGLASEDQLRGLQSMELQEILDHDHFSKLPLIRVVLRRIHSTAPAAVIALQEAPPAAQQQELSTEIQQMQDTLDKLRECIELHRKLDTLMLEHELPTLPHIQNRSELHESTKSRLLKPILELCTKKLGQRATLATPGRCRKTCHTSVSELHCFLQCLKEAVESQQPKKKQRREVIHKTPPDN